MPEEVIRPQDGLKGCLVTVGFAVLMFILCSLAYIIYTFYFDDSLPMN